MLAFDIETTGLDHFRNEVTVVALYGEIPRADGGSDEHVDEVLNFARDGEQAHRAALLQRLGRAHTLCAFNGVRFDVPFLMHALRVPPEECSEWVRKLYDPFEEHKLLSDRTISLNKVLDILGMGAKCGSGADAVRMARAREWDSLEFYCRQDAVLTHRVAQYLLARRCSIAALLNPPPSPHSVPAPALEGIQEV